MSLSHFLSNLILHLTPNKLKDHYYYNHPNYKKTYNSDISFSQEGEDIVLRRFFAGKTDGFYVDIGAHHPTLCSNTNYFFQRGWTGINIDGLPGNKKTFDEARPNDINLELLVSENKGTAEFYLFDPPLMNTMLKAQAEKNKRFEWCKFIGTVIIPTCPLSEILDQHLKSNQSIDFLSIDVEGAEMSVLKSNNWDKYSPKVVLVELIDSSVEEVLKSEIHYFLTRLSYIFFGKTGNTVFYHRQY